ncbi:MAG: alpha/beta fold hydrolase [Sphingomonadaceae bacterium]|nr:alpha/beta fold hydrolase [Sphingomonadaceae bacterium]
MSPFACEIGGQALRGLRSGEGGARGLIVALHGGGYDANYWHASDAHTGSLLSLGTALGFDTVAIDRPGYRGSATESAAGLSLAEQADLVFALIDRIADGRGIFLIGHSMGGILSLVMAGDDRAGGWLASTSRVCRCASCPRCRPGSPRRSSGCMRPRRPRHLRWSSAKPVAARSSMVPTAVSIPISCVARATIRRRPRSFRTRSTRRPRCRRSWRVSRRPCSGRSRIRNARRSADSPCSTRSGRCFPRRGTSVPRSRPEAATISACTMLPGPIICARSPSSRNAARWPDLDVVALDPGIPHVASASRQAAIGFAVTHVAKPFGPAMAMTRSCSSSNVQFSSSRSSNPGQRWENPSTLFEPTASPGGALPPVALVQTSRFEKPSRPSR